MAPNPTPTPAPTPAPAAGSVKDKIPLMRLAMIVAAAEVANLPDELKPDPEGLDPSVVQQNQMTWRLARTYYSWLCQSVMNPEMWPAPPAGVSQLDLLEMAAFLTAGEIVNYPDNLKVDVDTVDPETIQESAAGWRIWRTFYAWAAGSIENDGLWGPAPPLGGSTGPAAGNFVSQFKAALPTLMADPDVTGKIKAAFMGG